MSLTFFILFSLGSRGDSVYIDDSKSSAMAESLTSHQYKSYIVDMIHKIRTNTEVQLGEYRIFLTRSQLLITYANSFDPDQG